MIGEERKMVGGRFRGTLRETEYNAIGLLLLQDLMKLFNEFLFLYSFFDPHFFSIQYFFLVCQDHLSESFLIGLFAFDAV